MPHCVLRPSGQAVVEDLRRHVSIDEIDAYMDQGLFGVCVGEHFVPHWAWNFAFARSRRVQFDILRSVPKFPI